MLQSRQVPHQVLNAKNNEREATIVAKAGEKGAVTLATNIAGRGTDIVLGEGVKELGGLFVLGTERHESRRIDNQLRGRSGRQGDPGVTQFFVSTEDDLMRIFGGERISNVMDRLNVDDDTPIENRMISQEPGRRPEKGRRFPLRPAQKRRAIRRRHEPPPQGDLRHAPRNPAGRRHQQAHQDNDRRRSAVAGRPSRSPPATSSRIDPDAKSSRSTSRRWTGCLTVRADKFETEVVKTEAAELYEARRKQLSRRKSCAKSSATSILQVLDNLWMQHLENMDHLREGIHWMSVGQRDPLVEYRRQGRLMFDEMQQNLRHEIVRTHRSTPSR